MPQSRESAQSSAEMRDGTSSKRSMYLKSAGNRLQFKETMTLGRAALTGSLKNNIGTGNTQCVLVPTLKIYYGKGYGAIEMSVHRSLHPRPRRRTERAKDVNRLKATQ